MKPSKELTEKIKLAKQIPNNEAIAWAELLMSIPLVVAGFTTIPSALYDSEHKRIMDEDEMPKKGSKFNLHFYFPESDENEKESSVLSINFFTGNKAKIDKKPFEGKIPKFLIENPVFGFEGTWEEVTFKLIELCELLNSVPAIPDSLKK